MKPMLLRDILPAAIGADPRTPAKIDRARAKTRRVQELELKLERLHELEKDLGGLLATSAPVTWRELRRTLWRILRRARRELRAAERAARAEPVLMLDASRISS